MKTEDTEKLCAFITEKYGFPVYEIAPAKRGFFGETWRLRCGAEDYFVKLDYWDYHKESYRRSLPVTVYLAERGIHFVPAAVKTKTGALSCEFNNGVLAVFPFIEGENTEDYPLYRLFERLAAIYRLKIENTDLVRLKLEQELFGTEILSGITELTAGLKYCGRAGVRAEELLGEKRELLVRYAGRLKFFAARCGADKSDYCLTHGDAGGNCILRGEEFVLIDWDQPKVAPIERDAWFFMHRPEQTEEIQAALHKAGVSCQLKTDRFCYYCYNSFFYYLSEYLKSLLYVREDMEKQRFADGIESFFSSWIFDQLKAADLIHL